MPDPQFFVADWFVNLVLNPSTLTEFRALQDPGAWIDENIEFGKMSPEKKAKVRAAMIAFHDPAKKSTKTDGELRHHLFGSHQSSGPDSVTSILQELVNLIETMNKNASGATTKDK